MASSAFLSPVALGPRSIFVQNGNMCLRRCETARSASIRPNWRMNIASSTAFKVALLERLAPLDFGRTVAKDAAQQEEIEALIRQVEATNQSRSPGTDPNLTGMWDLLYTTSQSILGLRMPAFLRASRIVQELNGEQLTGRNSETVKFGPFALENAIEAQLIPTSPNRFDVDFVRFVIAGFIKIDVKKRKERIIAWLEITYLDEDLRISRGSKGNVFVLVKK